jgi:lipopolysaccharide heptosyltransferase II
VTNGNKIDHSKVKRILIQKLRAIGDVVLSTVVLRNLRNAFPDAVIDFLTESPSSQVLEGNPQISSVIVFNPKTGSGFNLINDIRKRRYDLIIDLFGNPRSAIITFFSRARYKVGYSFGWRKYCYNRVIKPRGGEIHNIEFNLDALRFISVDIIDKSPRLYVGKEDHEFAENFFDQSKINDGLTVAINPSGGWYTKRWPIAYYAGLAGRIVERFNVKVLILWGPGEIKTAEEMQKLIRTGSFLIPPATLRQMAAIVSRCAILVTNDSGPMHIAAALGVPVVAIFGPTNPDFQGPIGTQSVIIQKKDLDCLGCNLTKCPIGNPCMEKLSMEDVFGGVEVLLKNIESSKNMNR